MRGFIFERTNELSRGELNAYSFDRKSLKFILRKPGPNIGFANS
jgi:hypothetical protein